MKSNTKYQIPHFFAHFLAHFLAHLKDLTKTSMVFCILYFTSELKLSFPIILSNNYANPTMQPDQSPKRKKNEIQYKIPNTTFSCTLSCTLLCTPTALQTLQYFVFCILYFTSEPNCLFLIIILSNNYADPPMQPDQSPISPFLHTFMLTNHHTYFFAHSLPFRPFSILYLVFTSAPNLFLSPYTYNLSCNKLCNSLSDHTHQTM